MLFNLLTANSGDDTMSWVVIVILIAAMVLLMVFSNRAQKKQAQKAQEMINAIRPGNKVKTIGGICGTIVNIKDDVITIETSLDRTLIEFKNWAIREVKKLETDDEPAK